MPREMITGQDGQFNVHVGWSHSTVQVGVETMDGRALVSVLYGTDDALERIGRRAVERGWPGPDVDERGGSVAAGEAYQAIGRTILDLVEGNPADVAASYTGPWCTLDRQGTNRMVKQLRRARDAAFGADE